MDTVVASMVVVPGLVALLLSFVFTYLYVQSRREYFRAWQIGWIAYTLHYALDTFTAHRISVVVSLVSSLLLVLMSLCIFVSTRLTKEKFDLRWYDLVLAVAGTGLAIWNMQNPLSGPVFRPEASSNSHFRLEIFLAGVMLYCSFFYYRLAHRKNSLAFRFLSFSLALWAVLTAFGQVNSPYGAVFGTAGHLLGPVPQMILGIAMVMVLFENERNAVQENALAFSTLGVDPARLLSAEQLVPKMQSILDRLVAPLPSDRALVYISERWRAVLPSVQRGLSPALIARMEKSGAGEYIAELAYRRGGFVTFRNIAELTEPLPAFPGKGFEQFCEVLKEEKISHLTAVSLQTREHNYGAIIFPYSERNTFGLSNLRLLIGLALQIGLTIEGYIVMHDAQRRTKEYELMTEIGQAISSRLDQDEMLRTVQQELNQIFDTNDFYVAFLENDNIRFEVEFEKGKLLPKRSRKVLNGFTEYIIRTGQSLLIRSEVEKTRERLGVTFVPERTARSFCGVPIVLAGKPAGAMVATSYDREYLFEARDLEVMETAAAQVAVAIENARLFADEQRRSRQLSFLNSISKAAISSEDSEQMLAEIVAHIQHNFRFDHIGIGILDYATKEIEIRAEAGTEVHILGKRIPLGTGVVGRVARTGEMALIQTSTGGPLQGLLPDAKAILSIPICYGETLMGVLNVESREEEAFSPQDVLVMNTLADLLATALHNSFVFQKLQQQSITDGLTGIKTRRFFWESVTSEWRRAARNGRPFSVVLIDLDKFKEVNDSLGHLEGDLVLSRVGRLLEQRCRQSNVVARYGGDEFIILMPETGVEQAQILAERLRLWIATDPMLSEHQVTGSFGVASFPVHGFSAEDIIRIADAGMYVSKHAGGNRVSTAEESSDSDLEGVQRQKISGYIEGFLQREHTGPEHLEELLETLKKLCSGEQGEDCNIPVLREAIAALARATELREPNGPGHGEMTARVAELIARALDMHPDQVLDLTYAARVHDVGKIFVPERILRKSGNLSEEESALLQMHARVGAEIVKALPESEFLQSAIAHHHEAFDGSGYPDKLRGEEIPLWGRIISVADAYVNMTGESSYAVMKSPEQAIAELERLSGIRYDGMLIRILMRELRADKASSLGFSEI